ncbi:hypothetical protein ACFL67_03640 [candidate division KSB1 bacterium]
MSPTGYIAAQGSHVVKLISPDGRFLFQTNFKESVLFKKYEEELNIFEISLSKVVYLNENDGFFLATGYETERTPSSDGPNTCSLLFYVKNGQPKLCAQYWDKFTVPFIGIAGATVQAGHEYLGKLYHDIVEENKVVYSHTGYDKTTGEDGFAFTLKVYNFTTDEIFEITLPYNPVAIPDSVIEKGLSPHGYSFTDQSFRPFAEDMRKRLREVKYLPPVRDIIADGKNVFVVTYDSDYSNQYPAFVVNIETGDQGAMVIFPEPPAEIKGGYAYSKSINNDGFPVIKKYRIDPAVYRER